MSPGVNHAGARRHTRPRGRRWGADGRSPGRLGNAASGRSAAQPEAHAAAKGRLGSADPTEPIRRRVDEAIERAIADGAFDRLPGAGRPLELGDENPFVPEDLRIAFEIMRDAGLAPDWVGLRREIETETQALRGMLARHQERMRRARESLPAGRAGDFARRLREAAHAHERARAEFAHRVHEVQRLIDRFNAIAPEGAPRFSYWPGAELAAFNACWQWRPTRTSEAGG